MGSEAQQVGPFVLLEQLGKGGMGEVWLARAAGLPGVPELCVVKTLRAEAADDPDAVRRFVDEARLALMLAHPRVVRVVDAGRAGGMHYLALELLEGIDIKTLMRRAAEAETEIDDGVALWIAACTLDALAFAHTARHPTSGLPLGVVHRDISPHNIMAAVDGSARVIDFGLALSSVKQARTEQNVVMGKLAYMAPEQARGEAVDGRCDIFATGVVLYEMLARDRFWGSRTSDQIWSSVGQPTYEPRGLAGLAPDVQSLLRLMIERDVNLRIGDAGELRFAVARLLAARGGAPAASARLAALVAKLAAPELERIARVRPVLAAPPPMTVPPMTMPPTMAPNSESIALVEAAAVQAALSAHTLELPAFTALLEERRDTLMLAVTDESLAGLAGLVPRAPTATMKVSRAAPAKAAAAASPPSTSLAPRSRSRVVGFAAAGVAAALLTVTLVVAAALSSSEAALVVDAGIAAPPSLATAPLVTPPLVTPPPVTSPVTSPTPVPAPPLSVPVTPPAHVPPPPKEDPTAAWARKLDRLHACKKPCAKPYEGVSLSWLTGLDAKARASVLPGIDRCAAECQR